MPFISSVRGSFGPQGRFGRKVALFPFTTHTFTPAGLTGRFGPTLTQVRSAYNTTWDENPLYFGMTYQGVQEFTIPETGLYQIELAGGRGGNVTNGSAGGYGTANENGTFYAAGNGAILTINANLIASEKLIIAAGQVGTTQSDGMGAGGGGASWVSINTVNNLLAIAGGGGGAGKVGVGRPAPANVTGNGERGTVGADINYDIDNEGQNGQAGTAPFRNTGAGVLTGTSGSTVIHIAANGGAGWLGGYISGLDRTNQVAAAAISALSGSTYGIGGVGQDGASGYGGFGGGGGGAGNWGYGGGGGGYSGGGPGAYLEGGTVPSGLSSGGGVGGGGGSWHNTSNSTFISINSNSSSDGYVKLTKL